MTQEISTTRLNEIFENCLFKTDSVFEKDGETTESQVFVKGVIQSFYFNPQILSGYKEELKQMIGLLNTNFLTTKEGGGGGWSFLQIPFYKDGSQWGEHRNAEQLACLCIANKLAARLMPAEFDQMMPGGVPYFVFTLLDNAFDIKAPSL